MRTILLRTLCVAGSLLPATFVWAESTPMTVTKPAEPFDTLTWEARSFAGLPAELSIEAGGAMANGRALRVDAVFHVASDRLFVSPAAPLVIPGRAGRVAIRYRTSDPDLAVSVLFRDGWGREQVAERPLEWAIPAGGDGWRESSFDVPAEWVQPVSIRGVSGALAGDFAEPRAVSLWLDELVVSTDLSAIDPATGTLSGWTREPDPPNPARAVESAPAMPLVGVAVTTTAEGNTFQDAAPEATVTLRNWQPTAIRGTLIVRVSDDEGNAVARSEHTLAADHIAAVDVPLPITRYGRYRVDAELITDTGERYAGDAHVVHLAPRRALSDAERWASPYGLNVASTSNWPLDAYAKSGIVWYREYVFHWDRMQSAFGPGRDFSGWPHPKRIVQRFHDRGVHVMPVLQMSVTPPTIVDGKAVSLGPTPEWKAFLAEIVRGLPEVTHWELANEYGLSPANLAAEEACDWQNYGEYHRAFGAVIREASGGRVKAAENGQPGIFPERTLSQVSRGYFDAIDIVNTHHYTGVEPPELNYGNFNTSFDTRERNASLFFDDLRNTSRNADADGRDREHWFTEFGWDTRAGRVVSPKQQAAYLQRGWMIALAAGVEKSFWFFHLDAPTPKQFFDGCGMFDAAWQPKRALVAMAGLTARLPSPRYVGDFNLGAGTQGYVFEQDGKLVAAVWAIEERDAREVTIDAERLYDFAGNPIASDRVMLGIESVFAEGLADGSPWAAQTAYSLESDYLVLAAAGDEVRPVLRVDNRRGETITGEVALQLPAGWSAAEATAAFRVEPGSHALVELPVTVGAATTLGMHEVVLSITETPTGEVKAIPLRLLVSPPISMRVSSLSGRPGKSELTVSIANRSKTTRSGRLTLRLPAAWATEQGTIELGDMPPGDARELRAPIMWSDEWAEGESASVTFEAEGVPAVSQPVIPPAARVTRAPELAMDGDLSDWPDAARMPAWLLGSTMGGANAEMSVAWAPEGIYLAVDARDSKAMATDPRSFWVTDTLEVWLDTTDNKTSRKFGTHEHQFWIVPRVERGDVYLGRWVRDGQLEGGNRNELPVRGVSKRTESGYVMECLLPAELIAGYAPEAGKRWGLNLNLSVKGAQFDREVFWPRAKSSGLADPAVWGSVELVD